MRTDDGVDELMQPTIDRALAGWPAWRLEHPRAMKAGRLRWIAAGGEYEQPTGPELWIERRELMADVARRLAERPISLWPARPPRRRRTRTSRRPRLWNHKAF